jgi:hypothetical protein
MHKLVRLLAVLAISVATILPAAARPPELSGVVQAKEPFGRASLTWLFLKAYDVSLWTDAPRWSMNETFALTIEYNMSFTREEIAERTIEEMRRVAPGIPAAKLAGLAPLLNKLLPDVKSGDRISAVHIPGRPVQFFHNGKGTGQAEVDGFAEPFFGIWLSPLSAEPGIRKRLLRIER